MISKHETMDVIGEIQIASSVKPYVVLLQLWCSACVLKNKLETFDRVWLLFDLYVYLFQLDMLAHSSASPAKFS